VGAEDLEACVVAMSWAATRARDRLAAGIEEVHAHRAEAAWQTVFHFHVHVIPRYADDPLRLPWIPHSGEADEIAAAGAALRS
jgi:histidine triad (HIT) family protein